VDLKNAYESIKAPFLTTVRATVNPNTYESYRSNLDAHRLLQEDAMTREQPAALPCLSW